MLYCAEGCGAVLEGRKTLFCSRACTDAYHNVQTVRGRVLMPLVMAAATRRYGGSDRELCAYARREADALVSRWLVEDRAVGRRSEVLVAAKIERGWRACDL